MTRQGCRESTQCRKDRNTDVVDLGVASNSGGVSTAPIGFAVAISSFILSSAVLAGSVCCVCCHQVAAGVWEQR